MKVDAKAWRESASLILLARNNSAISEAKADQQNYKMLTYKRPPGSSFMPNAVVFPGGQTEPSDEVGDWLKHFRNCGISEEKLAQLNTPHGARPGIFESLGLSRLKREISLRITAIRETFEEIGILICRRKNEVNVEDDFGGFVEEFTKKEWQKLVHGDPSQFLSLCQEHELVPDIWRLYEWSVWLTPAKISKRFETAFFIVSLHAEPKILPDESEACDPTWDTPSNLLSSYHSEAINLATPQAYEITRISKYKNIKALTEFAKTRSNLGTTLQFPVFYLCAEGALIVFPGDHLYPENPDLNLKNYDAKRYAKLSFDELRKMSVKMHRCEQRTVYDSNFLLNFDLPNGHVGPMAKL